MKLDEGRAKNGGCLLRQAADESNRSQRFLQLSLGFWSGQTRTRAWLLTAAIFFFLFANLGTAIAVNRWNKFFFDALEELCDQGVVMRDVLREEDE